MEPYGLNKPNNPGCPPLSDLAHRSSSQAIGLVLLSRTSFTGVSTRRLTYRRGHGESSWETTREPRSPRLPEVMRPPHREARQMTSYVGRKGGRISSELSGDGPV